MRRMLHAVAWSVAIASAAVAAQGRRGGAASAIPAKARAEIKGQGIAGLATFVEEKNGESVSVAIRIMVKGMPPGMHGVHVHAVGKCEGDFTSAGGHFDPGPAGNVEPDANHPFHMGDLPNLNVPVTGGFPYDARTTRVTLSDGPLSLFDADGSAIVLHADLDKGVTGPPRSGVSGGARVACGVIVKG